MIPDYQTLMRPILECASSGGEVKISDVAELLAKKLAIKAPKGSGVEEPRPVPYVSPVKLEDRWTGGYIFENGWLSFRIRQNRKLELMTAPHTYDRPGRYTVAVKMIDIFGNDTMTLVPVNVG